MWTDLANDTESTLNIACDSGTPTAGLDLTLSVYVVCAPDVGTSPAAAGQAQRAQGAHIVSRTVKAIKNAKS